MGIMEHQMIISNTHKFIFIHVPKCAGSTTADILSPYTQWNDIELGVSTYGENTQQHYRERFGLWKHSSAMDIQQTVGDDVFSTYFKFAFVRNPLFRIISFYNFIQKLRSKASPKMLVEIDAWPISDALAETQSFPEFIRHPGIQEPPMHKLLTDCSQVRPQILVDFVGRVENFDDDIAFIFNQIGLPAVRQMKKRNASQKTIQKLSDYYSSKDDLLVIYDKYRSDFDILGYSIEDSIARLKQGL